MLIFMNTRMWKVNAYSYKFKYCYKILQTHSQKKKKKEPTKNATMKIVSGDFLVDF